VFKKLVSNNNEYNELLSPDHESATKSIAQTLATTASSKDAVAMETDTQSTANKSDDLDFWLSTTASNPVGSKRSEPTADMETDEVAESANVKKTKSKKSKKSTTPDEHKSKKKKEKKVDSDELHTLEIAHDHMNGVEARESGAAVKDAPVYHRLASNKTVEITYRARPNFMNLNQIVVDLRLRNVSSSEQIFQIELNILDTPNIKLIREKGMRDHALSIPFSLDASVEDHVEYFFGASESTYPQKLKGIHLKEIKKGLLLLNLSLKL
jgi:hypothetical protein